MRNRIFPILILASALQFSPSLTPQAKAAPPAGFEKVDTTIVLETLAGKMKYSQGSFTVNPGSKVHLIIDNKDELQHNFVLCREGKGNGIRVAESAVKLGEEGFAKGWIPNDKRILLASGMVDPHKKESLYFYAPKKPGRYEYVCTFPGHFNLMKGVMMVAGTATGTGAGKGPLKELTYVVYQGRFGKLPDFSKLEPKATDHVKSGVFDIDVTKLRENFALVFDGILSVSKKGTYNFNVGSDDGSRLIIDGKVVVDHDSIHGMTMKSGKVDLSEGDHKIRFEYFEASGEEELYVGWSGPGFKEKSLCTTSSKSRRKRGRGTPSGMLLASENGEAKIYRNFIEKGGTRAIGVGYPTGHNIAFNADTMNISLLWKGDFIDAARHWNGRGQGFQPPAGDTIVAGHSGEPFAVLDSANAPWPKAEARSKIATFKGYKLDEKRFPTFGYTVGDTSILDRPAPTPEGLSLSRSLTIKGSPSQGLYYRVAVSSEIKKEGVAFLTNEGVRIGIKGATPLIATLDGNAELRIPIAPNTKKLELLYTW